MRKNLGNREGTQSMLTRAAAGALLLAVVLMATATPVRAQVIVAMVNGDPVTAFDVEHRAKLKEGKRFGVDLSKSDVDEQFDAMARRMKVPSEQLAKALEQQGIRPETLKARIKADFVWQQ